MKLLLCVTVLTAGWCVALAAKWPVDSNGEPCACTRLHSPVCGHDGQDYPNPQCAKNCGKVTGFIRGTCDRPALCGCPFIDAPVCARRPNGVLDTFPNSCTASCSNGAEKVHDGPCSAAPAQLPELPGELEQLKNLFSLKSKKRSLDGCACPRIYQPVCGLKDGQWFDYASDCTARCAGVERVNPGKCGQGDGCICTRHYRPVCARKPDGTLKDYSNGCTANCDGAITVSQGRCPAKPDNSLPAGLAKKAVEQTNCVCTQEYSLVCGLKDRQWVEYPNRCVARCSLASHIRDGPCVSAGQHPVFPDDKYPAQLPVFPDNPHAAQIPYFPDEDSDESDDDDLIASQLPVFPSLFRKQKH